MNECKLLSRSLMRRDDRDPVVTGLNLLKDFYEQWAGMMATLEVDRAGGGQVGRKTSCHLH